MTKKTAIQRAVELIGGATKTANLLGVTTAAVYQWTSGERPVPAQRAPVIAHASGVPVSELCPSVPWELVVAMGQQMAGRIEPKRYYGPERRGQQAASPDRRRQMN